MGVEILIQDLAGILAEVPPLPPGIQEPGPQDHDRLAGGLLQLDLDRVKFPIDDGDHAVNLLRGDGPGPGLLAKQIHHVSCELFTTLKWNIKCFTELRLYDSSWVVNVMGFRPFNIKEKYFEVNSKIIVNSQNIWTSFIYPPMMFDVCHEIFFDEM